MPSTREKLIDWLAELPDNTEIGIEDMYLVAMIGTATQSFLVGDLTDESVQDHLEAYSTRRKEMMTRMLQIHEQCAEQETEEVAIIVTFEGYICGEPVFFTSNVDEAFTFKDRTQAGCFVAEFADLLLNPQVLDSP